MTTNRSISGISIVATVLLLLLCAGGIQAYTTALPMDYLPSGVSGLGGVGGRVYDINIFGDVVGYGVTTGGQRQAIIWHDTNQNGVVDPGEVNSLGTLGGSESGAFSINDSGQAVGWSWTTGDVTHEATMWTDNNHNYQLDPGELVGLGDLGGGKSRAYSVNNSGQVAGFAFTPPPRRDAVRWTTVNGNSAGIVDIGTLGGQHTYGEGINSLGHVVGSSEISMSGPTTHAFKWVDANNNDVAEQTEVKDLGTLGGTNSWAWSINDQDIVAGEADLASGDTHAFIYNDLAGMVDLGTLGGTDSYAYDINSLGHVVGMSLTADGTKHAFIWDGIGMTDLNDIIPVDPGWVLTVAHGINNIDEVCGWGYFNGQPEAFVLTHQPEPATLLLLGSGLVGFALKRNKKG